MRAKGGGAIVNLGSIAGISRFPAWCLPDLQGGDRGADASACARFRQRQYPRDLRRPGQHPDAAPEDEWYTPEGRPRWSNRSACKDRMVPVDVAALVTFLASRRREGDHRARIFRRRGLALTVSDAGPADVWDPRRNSAKARSGSNASGQLWFVDIKKQRIHRFDPASGARRSWDAPAQAVVLPAERGGFVAGLQSGLHHFDEASGNSR